MTCGWQIIYNLRQVFCAAHTGKILEMASYNNDKAYICVAALLAILKRRYREMNLGMTHIPHSHIYVRVYCRSSLDDSTLRSSDNDERKGNILNYAFINFRFSAVLAKLV